jgi:outer membrane receptor for ferrienterochelin and colicin
VRTVSCSPTRGRFMVTHISHIKKGLRVVILGMAACLALFSSSALAQTATATIEGTITDPSGAVLSAARVEIRGDADSRTLTTDPQGHYRAVGLLPGTYDVSATLAPFQAARVERVTVAVNRIATINLRLELGQRNETVVVSAPPGLLQTTTSAVSRSITARELETTPVNGRNYLDLVLMTPGVINSGTRTELADRDTRGAIFGDRGGNAAFLIDGFDNSDDVRGGVFQSYTQDAVQEFEVIGAGYKAEFGRGSGGVINVVTKSGTNTTKGTGAFFLRDDALDASPIEGKNAEELGRYNTSVVVGGPITADRAWYFGALEHLFERRAAIFPATIPDILKRDEDFSTHPETDLERAFGKYTRSLQNGRSLRAEGGWSRQDTSNQLSSSNALPSSHNDALTKSALMAVGHRFVAGSQLMLDSVATYRDQRFNQNPGLGQGFNNSFTLPGIGSFEKGPRYGSRQTLDQHYLGGRMSASLFHGGHAAKAGLEYLYTAVNGSNAQAFTNTIITSLTNLEQFGFDQVFAIPQGYGFPNPGDELSRLRNHGGSAFLQDDWRLAPSLTLNLGVRWDYDSKFNDTNNAAPRLGVAWSFDDRTVVRANWGLFYDRYRLGLAQAVPELGGFNARTFAEYNYPHLAADAMQNGRGSLTRLVNATQDRFVLHKLFGLSETAVVTRDNVQQLTGLTPDQFVAAVNSYLATSPIATSYIPVDWSPITGYLRQDVSAIFQDRIRVARPFKTPFNNTVSIGAERRVVKDVTASATFVGRAFRNILGIREPNLAFESRVSGQTTTTDGGPLLRTYGPWYDGEYRALVLAAQKPYDGHYQWQFSYTYATGTDNLLNPNLAIGVGTQGGGSAPTDNLDLEFDRGRSDLLTPHVVVASGSVGLPRAMTLSGVFRATSGAFFSASAAAAGIDYDQDGIRSTRPPTTTRNEFTGPSFVNVDVRLEKTFKIGRYSASGLIEFFNVFNRSNPSKVENSYTTEPVATFGEVLVPYPGREAQLGFRLTF